MIKFYYGPYNSYSSTTHADGIYFATDKKVIRLNGVDYIGNINVDGTNFIKSITKNSEGKLNVTLGNGTTTTLTAVTLMNNLTTTKAGQGALDAYQGKILLDKINEIGSVYRVKGTVADKTALLAVTSASVGDVYNMTASCTLNGNSYSAGTNFVCTTKFISVSTNKETCWDALGGTMTGYATESYVQGMADSIDANIAAELTKYLKSTDAENIYLKKTNASSTYLTKTDASNTYLPKTTASNTYLEKTKAAIMTESDAYSFIRVGDTGAYTAHTKRVSSGGMCWKIVSCTPVSIDGNTTEYRWIRIGYAPFNGSSTPNSKFIVQQAVISNSYAVPEESSWDDLTYFNGINLSQIATNTSKITKLNADSSTAGSVDYKIAQALSWNVVS